MEYGTAIKNQGRQQQQKEIHPQRIRDSFNSQTGPASWRDRRTVHHGNDRDVFWKHTVNDEIRKALQWTQPSFPVDDGKYLRLITDEFKQCVQLR